MRFLRIAATVLVGGAIWWFLFLAVGIACGLLWPDYADAARFLFREDDLSHFTTPMLFANFIVFTAAGLVVGWLATLAGGDRVAPSIIASLFFILMVVNHYILVWDELPGWYNVVVPFVIAGSILLGSRVVRGRANDIPTHARK